MQAVGTERRGLPVLAGGRHRKACPAGVDCPACRRLATAPRGSPSRWSADATLLLPETKTRRKNRRQEKRRHTASSSSSFLSSSCRRPRVELLPPLPQSNAHAHRKANIHCADKQVTGDRLQVPGCRLLLLLHVRPLRGVGGFFHCGL